MGQYLKINISKFSILGALSIALSGCFTFGNTQKLQATGASKDSSLKFVTVNTLDSTNVCFTSIDQSCEIPAAARTDCDSDIQNCIVVTMHGDTPPKLDYLVQFLELSDIDNNTCDNANGPAKDEFKNHADAITVGGEKKMSISAKGPDDLTSDYSIRIWIKMSEDRYMCVDVNRPELNNIASSDISFDPGTSPEIGINFSYTGNANTLSEGYFELFALPGTNFDTNDCKNLDSPHAFQTNLNEVIGTVSQLKFSLPSDTDFDEIVIRVTRAVEFSNPAVQCFEKRRPILGGAVAPTGEKDLPSPGLDLGNAPILDQSWNTTSPLRIVELPDGSKIIAGSSFDQASVWIKKLLPNGEFDHNFGSEFNGIRGVKKIDSSANVKVRAIHHDGLGNIYILWRAGLVNHRDRLSRFSSLDGANRNFPSLFANTIYFSIEEKIDDFVLTADLPGMIGVATGSMQSKIGYIEINSDGSKTKKSFDSSISGHPEVSISKIKRDQFGTFFGILTSRQSHNQSIGIIRSSYLNCERSSIFRVTAATFGDLRLCIEFFSDDDVIVISDFSIDEGCLFILANSDSGQAAPEIRQLTLQNGVTETFTIDLGFNAVGSSIHVLDAIKSKFLITGALTESASNFQPELFAIEADFSSSGSSALRFAAPLDQSSPSRYLPELADSQDPIYSIMEMLMATSDRIGAWANPSFPSISKIDVIAPISNTPPSNGTPNTNFHPLVFELNPGFYPVMAAQEP